MLTSQVGLVWLSAGVSAGGGATPFSGGVGGAPFSAGGLGASPK